MQEYTGKIILFPKWQEVLEKESLQALEQRRYEEALLKLNKLVSYRIDNHEIVFGKLICLMELERYDEAQNLCEELLTYGNENYYHYVHVYITILFQTSQYDMVIEEIENELLNDEIPDVIKDQFQQLYDMSVQMKQDIVNKESVEHIKELIESIDDKNYARQWYLIERLRKMKVNPPEGVIGLLVEDKIHPVIKTALFKWLQNTKETKSVSVSKFNEQIHINPSQVVRIKDHPITKQTLLLISELEHQNPSLYILLEQLLYRYLYVRYPMMPRNNEVIKIAEAIKFIGEQNLHKVDEIHNEQVLVEEIKTCEVLFLSIIED